MIGAGFALVGSALRVAVLGFLFSLGVAVGLAFWFVAAWGWLLALAFAFVLSGVAVAV